MDTKEVNIKVLKYKVTRENPNENYLSIESLVTKERTENIMIAYRLNHINIYNY